LCATLQAFPSFLSLLKNSAITNGRAAEFIVETLVVFPDAVDKDSFIADQDFTA
jgi:hypothetical protein